jgi:hypothetical protein
MYGNILVYTEDFLNIEKKEHEKTPEHLPLLADLEGLTTEEVTSKVPTGYYPLFTEKGTVLGYQQELTRVALAS